ncbi:hypothetical protein GCM10009682_35350 [Luedemannella flava]|uniref:VCBS repeat-containing protein n=2 Tax=Luedemannella flava TaxID=349316 RepID=A0ABP4YC97_9ACTN
MAVALWGAGPAAAAGCATKIASDFNGDTISDLAVGEVGRNGGAVRVLYGTASGTGTAGNQYFDRATPVFADILGPGDFNSEHQLGTALASGYFNDDCYADLAAGAPNTGRMVVFYGSVSGLTANDVVRFRQVDLGITAGVFGFAAALAAGDINGDGRDDLAVGQEQTANGGGVAVLYGAASGLTATGRQWITQDTAGVPGAGEKGDLFGHSVVLADFTGDKRADLAVGLPGESSIPDRDGMPAHNGSVVVLRGTTSGLTATGSQAWSQNTAGVPGAAEFADAFGMSLAAGDVNRDGRVDLAIGAPGEAIGTRISAGGVTVLRGATSGLTATGAQAFSQDTAGIPGAAEAGDRFGETVLLADRTGDGAADLFVGSPGEDLGTAFEAGSVTMLTSNKSTLVGTGAQAYSQNTANVPGANESGDLFGSSLRLVHGSTLVVGARGETLGTFSRAGAFNLLKLSAAGAVVSGTGTSAATLTNGVVGEGFTLGAPLG